MLEVDHQYSKFIENAQREQQYLQQVSQLLELTKKGDLREIVEFLDQFQNKCFYIDEIGNGGWNAFHFSIFYNYVDIFNYFVNQNCNLNQTTIDGFSPLQLAIHKNRIQIFINLVQNSMIQINQQTQIGSALQIAIQENKHQLVCQLLFYGASLNQVDLNKSTINLDEQMMNIIRDPHSNMMEDQLSFYYQKPPIVQGYLSKVGRSLIKTNRRYFYLDPYEGTFSRYLSKSDYPIQPIETISLSNLISISKMEQNERWYFKKDCYYFQLTFKTFKQETQVIADNNEFIIDSWIASIVSSIKYYINLKNEIRNDKYNEADKEFLKQSEKTIELTEQNCQQLLEMNQHTSIIRNLKTIQFSSDDINNNIQKSNTISRQISNEKQRLTLSIKNSLNSLKNTISDKLEPQQRKMSIHQSIFDKQNSKQIVKDVKFKSFNIIKNIGSGSFGKVFLVQQKVGNQVYAMKALKKRQLIIRNLIKYAISEAQILKKLRNQNFIINLKYAFQTPHFLYLVTDYCSQQDISFHICHQGYFDVPVAKFYFCELVLAIETVHQHNIVYRDLKPENILIDNEGHIKLADFGLAKDISQCQRASSFCGSPAYLAPEMIKKEGIDKAADLYALGIVLYEMLMGEPPFRGENVDDTYSQIVQGEINFKKGIKIPNEAKHLIQQLMKLSPKERLGYDDYHDIKKHAFFKDIEWQQVMDKQLQVPINYIDSEDEQMIVHHKIDFVDYDYDVQNQDLNRIHEFDSIFKCQQ